MGNAELVDRRAAGGEIFHHLTGDVLWKSGNPAIGNTVIGRKNGDKRPPHIRPRICLPGGKPFHQLFHPAKASGRLGQLRIAGTNGGNGVGVRTGQRFHQCADIIERKTGGGGCHDEIFPWNGRLPAAGWLGWSLVDRADAV